MCSLCRLTSKQLGDSKKGEQTPEHQATQDGGGFLQPTEGTVHLPVKSDRHELSCIPQKGYFQPCTFEYDHTWKQGLSSCQQLRTASPREALRPVRWMGVLTRREGTRGQEWSVTERYVYTPRNTKDCQKPHVAGRGRKHPPLEPAEGEWFYPYLDVRLPALKPRDTLCEPH